MKLELEDEIQQQEEETIAIVAVALLLTTLTRFGTQGIPYNDLPLSGEDYTITILQGNPCQTLDVFRVTTPTFMFICRELLSVQMEPVSKLLQIEEQLAIFLYILGHNNSNRQAQDRFQHSGQTISKVFRHVLELLVQLAPKFFIQPSHETIPHQIQTNPKFSPFFDKCLGALDGVHIPASVPAHKTAPYRNRKGFLSQNVLGVCDFGMRFTYMRVGWEGTAHDARVLRDARSKDFKIRQGFFYLADAGYGLLRNILVPYRGTRYHLREQALAGQRPETKEELYNLRHSSLRNVIERCFGVFKRRFKIMTQASEYQLEQQYDLVLACACLHNINVGKNGYYDIIFDESLAMAEQYRATNTEDPPPEPEYPSERKRQHCENWRDSIAEGLWTQYMQTLQERLR
ncbi:hypothetical protein PSTG_13892 [Puccinia striiformis f. sp. tritici PST-78]|uniref:Uncharacterized protein n=1 Tax=Puccinia striiformis f. sp. tritici PST-78 TaxID=1165861 RepID=A0A0L0V0Z0_9BASI|nr:hypothetical protein PSTG_13892 [Puccinia striiformis f. sp. tritici PST-78]